MEFDWFTEKAREALQGAAELARDHGRQAMEPEHLLLALVREEAGVARTLLEPTLASAVERFPKVGGGGQPYLSPALDMDTKRGELTFEKAAAPAAAAAAG